MGFHLSAELAAVRGQGYDLHSKYLNAQMPRTLHTIGFDKDYVRGEGAYLYDAEGNAYADFLSGFGVLAAGLERVFFCSSGTEAVESALKFARHSTGKGRILYARHGFHGLTAGSLSVNGAEEFKAGFGPLLPGTQIPLGDLAALEAELCQG